MRKLLAAVMLLSLMAIPAWGRAYNREVLASQNITTAIGVVTATWGNPDTRAGLLIIKTTAEVASMTMAVGLAMATPSGNVLICSSIITTETTTSFLISESTSAAVADAYSDFTVVCKSPLGAALTLTLTPSGADAEMTTEVTMVEFGY